MHWWLCAHRAINVPLSQALTAQLASATFKAGSYLLQTSKASSVSCPQDAAQHQVAPGTGSLPSQAFATQACTIPRAGSGQCCAGTGPGASCPFPRVFVRPAGRPLPSCSAPVGSDLLAGVAPGAPQSVKYWLLAGFEQNQWSC